MAPCWLQCQHQLQCQLQYYIQRIVLVLYLVCGVNIILYKVYSVSITQCIMLVLYKVEASQPELECQCSVSFSISVSISQSSFSGLTFISIRLFMLKLVLVLLALGLQHWTFIPLCICSLILRNNKKKPTLLIAALSLCLRRCINISSNSSSAQMD